MDKKQIIINGILKGVLGAICLLAIYFAIVSVVSGWAFAQLQFKQYWFFIVTLAVGFGVQLGLYIYLKNVIKQSKSSKKVLAVSGTTSTVAMISCCAHYAVNFLPIIGAVGIVTVISQYQIQLFWVGLLFNLVGIAYMINKIVQFSKNK
jgi:P-type Cu+ transporter